MKVGIVDTNPIKTASTDSAYVMKQIPKISEFVELEFIHERNPLSIFHFVVSKLLERSPTKSLTRGWTEAVPPGWRSNSSRSDVAYSFGRPISRWSGPPLVYHNNFCPCSFTRDTAVLLKGDRIRGGDNARVATLVAIWVEASAEWFKNTFPELSHKVRVVPPFLPQLKHLALISEKTSFKTGRTIRLLFLGHDAKRKGLQPILDGYQNLTLGEKEQLEFRVCSSFRDGPISLPEAVDYIPGVSNPTELYQWADVFIMCSFEETYGFVLLEAMASGCCVVAQDDEQRKSILPREKNFLVNPLDPNSITKTLRNLIEDRDLITLSQVENRKFATTNYSPNVVANLHLDLFTEALKGPSMAKGQPH